MIRVVVNEVGVYIGVIVRGVVIIDVIIEFVGMIGVVVVVITLLLGNVFAGIRCWCEVLLLEGLVI